MPVSRIVRPDTAFALDPDRKATGGRVKSPTHLSFVRRLPCLRCGSFGVEAAHVRYGDPAHGKGKTAAFRKPDDCWTVPLCGWCHRLAPDAQHNSNERLWWEGLRIDPLQVASLIWAARPDLEKARLVCQHAAFVAPFQCEESPCP